MVSGNGPTLVPVGRDGRPLDFAMTWLDRRGVEEARLAAEATGRYVDPSFYLPKALWLFRHKPRVYRDTRHFLACPEFVDFFLTGEACTVLPSEPFQPYIWTAEAIEKLGMDPRKFPPFVRPGADIGRVRAEAEEVLGIPAGTPVFAGGPDFIMTLLGTATTVPGRACDRAGTSEGINLCTRAPVDGPAPALPAAHHRGLLERVGDHLHLRQGAGLVPGHRRAGRPRTTKDCSRRSARCPPGRGG